MTIQYQSQYVDEKYSAAIEPNLFTDEVLIPGVTYTDKYQEGPAGGIFVHKLTKGSTIEPGAPGRDFSDAAAADALIQVAFNNNFQKSTKMYGVQAAAVAFDMGESYLAEALNETKEGRRYSAVACMVNEGTATTGSASTKDTVVANLLSMRKAIKDAHGKANYALVSTEVYRLLLANVGFQENLDPAVAAGALIKRFGLQIIECNSFDNNAAVYYDYSGTKRTIDLTGVEMIVGYNEAFSALDNFNIYRIVDSELFAGSKAQVEYNSAFRVTSPTQIQVRKVAASI